MVPLPFSDEQLRALITLSQRYDTWIDVERRLRRLPYDLRRKEVSGKAYLYRISDRGGNGTSLGPWSDKNQTIFDRYRSEKAELKTRRETSRAALEEVCRLYRALRLPALASQPGPILREADRRQLLGDPLLVVGTSAMVAYAVEAGRPTSAEPEETDDFDLAWTAAEYGTDEALLLPVLKAVDPTYTVNSERPFQARNAKAYEVELLVAPSRSKTLPRKEPLRPVALPEQEWLLEGRRVDHVVACRDGSPARIVAPDPRWFALHKLWMSGKVERNPLKKPKDFRQGMQLLDAVATAMPQYPLDQAFADALPDALRDRFDQWQSRYVPPDRQPW